MTTKNEQSSKSGDKATGEKGVTQEQVGGGKEKDPNNFANNPERASAAGRKGGHNSHKNDYSAAGSLGDNHVAERRLA